MPRFPSSWIEIHPDNTILIRTGKSDFGQSTTFTAYRQIVAEELNAPFEADHHGGDGRHRSHAGRQRRLRFSRPRNAEHPQSGGLHLSGPARSGVAAARRSEERAFREGRHRFGRRQEHVVRRSGEGAAVEAHHPRERRPDQHRGIDGHRQSADEAGEPVHHHRQVFPQHRHGLQGHRARDNGPPTCGCPACCTRAWCIRRRFGSTLVSAGQTGQDPLSERAGRRERQSRRSGRAHGVGSHPRRAAGGRRHEVDGLERAARQREPVHLPERKRRLENDARHKSDKIERRRRARARRRGEEALRHLRASVHEARAHRTDHGRGRRSSGRDGAHLHAQPESAGAARRDRADARHVTG